MRFIAFILAVLGSVVSGNAQSRNAAEFYRMAGNAVPEASTPAEKSVLVDVFTAPLDAAAKGLVERAAKPLDAFDVASKMPFGEWGFDPQEALSTTRLMPHGSELADLVVLRARLRLADGQRSAALDDAFDIAQLSRRLSVQPSLPRQRQQNLLFGKASQLAGQILMTSSPAEITDFLGHLDQLRSPADPIDVVVAEKPEYLSYYQKQTQDSFLRRATAKRPMLELFGINTDPVDVGDVAYNDRARTTLFAETEKTFDDMLAAMKLDPAERDKSLDEIRARIASSHALVRMTVKIVEEALHQREVHVAMTDMLRMAADICETQPRPIDDAAARKLAGRFTYAPRSDGFELSWKPSDQMEPLVMRVGPVSIRMQPATQNATTKPATMPG